MMYYNCFLFHGNTGRCSSDLRVHVFFFFKQKTAYEMLLCDRSSDVCSSDLMPTSPASKELRKNHAGSGSPYGTTRSEERRVGKECTAKCRTRGWRDD